MNNTYGSSPFNGKLPAIQPPRVVPTVPPSGFEPVRVEETLAPITIAPTVPDVGLTNAGPKKTIRSVETEVEEDPHFSYEGYQVVRGEYFSHINEPSITFCDNRFSVNTACLKKSPGTEYVQVLVNQEQKKLAVRPCSEDVKDSFSWCTIRRKPKKVICPLFFGKIMSMMNWNQDHRYKIIGKLVHSQGQYLYVFDLNCPEIYTRTMQIDENGKEKRKTARKPTYLDSWKDHFGVPVDEHEKALQISIFDGYALIGVKEPKQKAATTSRTTEEGAYDQSENSTLDPGGYGPLPDTNS